MRLTRMFSVAVLVLPLVVTSPTAAQGLLPFSAEVRAGVAFSTGDLAEDAEIDMGYGFEINGKYQFNPLLAIYAGYDRYEFSGEPEEAIGNVESELTDAGVVLGAQVSLPLPGFGPWVRGGIMYNQATTGFSDDGASLAFESERALGFEVGGGLSFPLGPFVSVTPGVRYRAHSPEFEIFDEPEAVDISYLVVDLGLSVGF